MEGWHTCSADWRETKILVKNAEGKEALVRSRRRWWDNIRRYLREV